MTEFTEDQIEAAARAAHEVNRAYCREVIHDHSHIPWDYVPDEVKEGVLSGVRALVENPNMTPADGHDVWCRFKRERGWVYGPAKSRDAKTHPRLVEFEHLSMIQRARCTIFGLVARASLGLEHTSTIDNQEMRGTYLIKGQVGQ